MPRRVPSHFPAYQTIAEHGDDCRRPPPLPIATDHGQRSLLETTIGRYELPIEPAALLASRPRLPSA